MSEWVYIITCEHGGNQIPEKYQHLFQGEEEVLQTHRGYDPGALELAREFAAAFEAPVFYTKISRLLVETNRSIHHPHLFSRFTKSLDPQKKVDILHHYYYSYRNSAEEEISRQIKQRKPVLHLSIHSCTPVLNDEVRNMDCSLLYDSRRKGEKEFCRRWKRTFQEFCSQYTMRFNFPYRGSADGFTTYLRKQFSDEQYLGIEVEVNQKHVAVEQWWDVKECMIRSLKILNCR
ncbi:MAG: N-formylglutamate amidohydrolase [bacterium]|jgi:predicted N-formylglutamate amidohydrolase